MRIRITASSDEQQRVKSADPVLLDRPQLDDELQEAHLDLDVGWVVGHVKAGNSGLLERHLVNKRYPIIKRQRGSEGESKVLKEGWRLKDLAVTKIINFGTTNRDLNLPCS